MRAFLNLTIPRKLALAFALMILVALVYGGVTMAQLLNIRDASRWTSHTFEVIETANALRAAAIDQQTGIRGFVEGGRKEFLRPYQQGRAALAGAVDKLRTLTADNPRQQERIAHLSRDLELWHTEYAEPRLAAPEDLPREQEEALATLGKRRMDGIRQDIAEIVAEEQRLLKERMDRETRAFNWAIAATILGGVLLAAVAVTGWWLLSRGIATPILEMTRLMLRLADDDLAVTVPGAGRRDELGGMARAMTVFKANAQHRADLRRANEAATRLVRENEARLSAIFDSVQEGIVTIGPDGRVESANGAVLRLFSCDRDDLSRAGLSGLVADDTGRGIDRAALEAALGGGHSVTLEATGLRPGGGRVPVELTASRTGGEGLLTLSLRDISARREMDRLKNEFISTVSHELRTPLTSIRGSLGLVQGLSAALPDKMRSLVEIAYRNTERLINLVNDILDIEKIESGRMDFTFRRLDMAELAAHAVEGDTSYAEGRGIRIALEAPDHPVPVVGDAQRLQQVIANLLSNAIKFSPDGGEVRVRVTQETAGNRRFARLSVHDAGPGVPEEFRSRIFQKFAQADSADSRAKGGTGLGLSISRMIAERHGGGIDFTSRPGDTVFQLVVPLAGGEAPARADAVPPALAAGPVRPRILVCEDDHDVARLLRLMIEQNGYEVTLAHCAEEARSALSSGEFHGMTLDLGLPDEDGISLFRSLRRDPRHHALPVLVISAAAAEGARILNGDAVGILDWLSKPIDETRLAEVLRTHIAAAEGELPLVLYVEDDRDLRDLVERLLAGTARLKGAADLTAARGLLARERPDAVILDIGLGPESGLDLLPDISALAPPPPVLVFSAQQIAAADAGRVASVLEKSRTSNEELTRRVLDLINQKKRAARA
ncbi:MAG TPA: CHASE3 domain-containing protein [Azospirillaceae bacterium]|nr:CHASE3 domain-containing protein [Azospirillaceae bacterium]